MKASPALIDEIAVIAQIEVVVELFKQFKEVTIENQIVNSIQTLKNISDQLKIKIKSIEEDIAAYFQANKLAIKTENAYLSDYYKTPEQEYGVRCQLREKGRTRLDFTLTVQTKEQAEAICTNWQNQADDVFACLMDLLLK